MLQIHKDWNLKKKMLFWQSYRHDTMARKPGASLAHTNKTRKRFEN